MSLLPQSLRLLTTHVQVVQFWWDGISVQLPKHEVYAIIPNPVPEKWVEHNNKQHPSMTLDKYQVPIYDPLHDKLTEMPKFAVVVSHHDGDRFGLYAYPADHIDDPIAIPYPEWNDFAG